MRLKREWSPKVPFRSDNGRLLQDPDLGPYTAPRMNVMKEMWILIDYVIERNHQHHLLKSSGGSDLMLGECTLLCKGIMNQGAVLNRQDKSVAKYNTNVDLRCAQDFAESAL